MGAMLLIFITLLQLIFAENVCNESEQFKGLENRIKALEKLAFLQSKSDCNCTNIEENIRENEIKIAENIFQLSVHRERLNEHEASIETNKAEIASNQNDLEAKLDSTKVEIEANIETTKVEIESEIEVVKADVLANAGEIVNIQNSVSGNLAQIQINSKAIDKNGGMIHVSIKWPLDIV